MLLADTSVWIQHFRTGQPALADYLSRGLILMHPSVMGELACGNLENRSNTLANLGALPPAIPASDTEALQFLGNRRRWGRGLGWTDVHLLASAMLTGCGFWTLDRRLGEVAGALGLNRIR